MRNRKLRSATGTAEFRADKQNKKKEEGIIRAFVEALVQEGRQACQQGNVEQKAAMWSRSRKRRENGSIAQPRARAPPRRDRLEEDSRFQSVEAPPHVEFVCLWNCRGARVHIRGAAEDKTHILGQQLDGQIETIHLGSHTKGQPV